MRGDGSVLTIALNFKGTALQALEFYGDVFGVASADSHVYQDEKNGRVAHAEIKLYNQKIFISDSDEDQAYGGFSLSINLTDKVELERAYQALSKGANIILPLQKVTWSESYGVLKDKFGITWQFNLD